ncbi:hypothetical protein ACIA98_36050 [Streptomyces sp. NPDC051366]|uniref:hypothetical protein n=1 Tax=Streptomyces sp. NPDC051366 TaxID=3365652 RepID=UPI0037AC9FF5
MTATCPFQTTHQIITEPSPDFQTIVSEHADLPHPWYQEPVRYNRRNRETWLTTPTPLRDRATYRGPAKLRNTQPTCATCRTNQETQVTASTSSHNRADRVSNTELEPSQSTCEAPGQEAGPYSDPLTNDSGARVEIVHGFCARTEK